MNYDVIWRQLPEKQELRRATFSQYDDAEREAKLFSLGITGPVETTIHDADGNRLYIDVREQG